MNILKKNICRLVTLSVAGLLCLSACKKSTTPSPLEDQNNLSLSCINPANTPMTANALPSTALIAYVETNNNNLNNMGLFTLSGVNSAKNGLPIVNVACIFAGNINLSQEATPKAVVSLNAQTYYLLEKTDYVKKLHEKGIKVTLSLLNNHDASGWSQFTSQADADYFAKSVKATVDKYSLDGVEVDNEYSNGIPNDKSMPMVIAAIRKLLPTKIIGLYLFNVSDTEIKNSASSITYAITNFGGTFTGNDIPANKIFVESSSLDIADNTASAIKNKGGGVMLFNANGGSRSDFNSFATNVYGSKAKVSSTALATDGPDNGNSPVVSIDKNSDGSIKDVHYYVLPTATGTANVMRSK
ncbi:glycosyl hydrolase family 18 protein [Pedobacter cryoconitis]|uniref:mannosyl-glycoprotein endo-beta-N-acetylglucosaminidase n=1 Tax=Pedobacter cryoconitis TaxID=188932 RepID=A0A7X0J894_9SPHI|nr:glycosyl hydrolase family 18 protein [Pedobacter cryoconitis]MBB6502888.1 hypothetical protein [Pedobacter cryoconitis]